MKRRRKAGEANRRLQVQLGSIPPDCSSASSLLRLAAGGAISVPEPELAANEHYDRVHWSPSYACSRSADQTIVASATPLVCGVRCAKEEKNKKKCPPAIRSPINADSLEGLFLCEPLRPGRAKQSHE